MKEIVIDFFGREDLVISTMKEFFEIFISSIKKEQVFHAELLSSNYNQVGIGLQFSSYSQTATMRIFLA